MLGIEESSTQSEGSRKGLFYKRLSKVLFATAGVVLAGGIVAYSVWNGGGDEVMTSIYNECTGVVPHELAMQVSNPNNPMPEDLMETVLCVTNHFNAQMLINIMRMGLIFFLNSMGGGGNELPPQHMT